MWYASNNALSPSVLHMLGNHCILHDRGDIFNCFNRNIDLDAEVQLCGMMLLISAMCCVAQESQQEVGEKHVQMAELHRSVTSPVSTLKRHQDGCPIKWSAGFAYAYQKCGFNLSCSSYHK